jgi:hypothetical protein
MAIVCLAFARWGEIAQRRTSAVLIACGSAFGLYVALLGFCRHRAEQQSLPAMRAALPSDEPIIKHSRTPYPADPLSWLLLTQTPLAVYRQRINLRAPAAVPERIPSGLDDPLVQHVSQSWPGTAWRAFSRHPLAFVTVRNGRVVVELHDARFYQTIPGREDWSALEVDLAPTTQPVRKAG